MKLNSMTKRVIAKWPILFLLLAMPALVFARQDDKDKKKNPPPPPPKKSAPANTSKQAPPQNTPPPKQNPPPKTPQNPSPANPGSQQGVKPAPGTPPPNGQPKNTPPNNGGQPNGGKPNGGQPGPGVQPVQPHNGVPPNTGQPNRGQPNGGQQGQAHGPAPAPQQVHIHSGNATVIRSNNPHVTTIHTSNGVTINHTLYGTRVVAVRPGGVTVVSVGRSRGFVQRPLGRPGFVQRTYVVGGRSYVRVYRNYSYRGIVYQRYVPGFYFGPRFYVWAYNPWARPVYWGWGWGLRTPWFYGGYFAPAPYYVSASLWLTDYIIAENLRASYEAQLEAQGQQYSAPPPDNSPSDPNAYNNSQISPAIRQAIADEVQRQLDAERNAASNPQQQGTDAAAQGDQAPPALSADQRVFIVSAPLQVNDGDQPCSLTAGDIVTRIEDTPGSDNAVAVSVLNSKNSDCRAGAQPRVQVSDLQDMQNDLRAQTDEGLKNLSQKQGTNGMPAAPDATQTPNPNGQGTPDPDAVNQLNQQRQDADQTEKEVGGGPGGGNVMLLPAPITPTPKPYAYFANMAPFIDAPPARLWRPIPDMTPNQQPLVSQVRQPYTLISQNGRYLRFTTSQTF